MWRSPLPALAYSYKNIKGKPGLASPYDGRRAIKNTYASTTNTLRSDLGFHSGS